MRSSHVFGTGFLSLEVETGSFEGDYVIFSLVRPFVSSVRSSSVYHGLLEGSSTHFFKFFKFFRFESESESERTQHVLYF